MDLADGGHHEGPDPGQYCREVESYLCRKNDGHLIRIVGPAFELVSGWAAQGIPLRVTFEGIDRFFERYYRKGPRRRPVHISFCEGDVLDVFDAWRRATGVPSTTNGDDAPAPRHSRSGLAKHLERTIAILTARRGSGSAGLDRALEDAVRELDLMRAAGTLRGDARQAALTRLRELDAALSAAARASLPEAQMTALVREAEESLAPFRARMPDAAWREARAAALERAIRTALRLPVIAFEAAGV